LRARSQAFQERERGIGLTDLSDLRRTSRSAGGKRGSGGVEGGDERVAEAGAGGQQVEGEGVGRGAGDGGAHALDAGSPGFLGEQRSGQIAGYSLAEKQGIDALRPPERI